MKHAHAFYDLLTCPCCPQTISPCESTQGLTAEQQKEEEKKEALRLEEEARYERWLAEMDLSSIYDGPADLPKRRMPRMAEMGSGVSYH